MAEGQLVRNKKVKLKKHVWAALQESDLEVVAGQIMVELKDEGTNDVLVKNLYLLCDPRMPVRRTDKFKPSETLEGFGVSKVVLSRNPNFKEGDYVTSMTKWEEYSVIPGGQHLKVHPSFGPGFTAYVGLHEILKPKRGETIFVSAASGLVGQMVGQLAKAAGLYVVGSAGSQKHIDLLQSKLGYDAAFIYKEGEDLVAALKKCCPRGIDMYFDNVGGKLLDAVLETMNLFGRIAVSGMISQYETVQKDGVYNLQKVTSKRITMQKVASKRITMQAFIQKVTSKRITMQGFIPTDYARLVSQFRDLMAEYMKANKVTFKEDFAHGLDNAPNALCRLMSGSKIGKSLILVGED